MAQNVAATTRLFYLHFYWFKKNKSDLKLLLKP